MVDAALRTQQSMREAWNSAKVEGGRINWPRQVVSDICALIAAGTHSVHRACAKHEKDHNAFLRLALRDPEIKDEYDLALQIRAENLADNVIEISDDDGNDLDWDGRPNNAAVRRSELRIKTRMELVKAANPGKYRERGANGGAPQVSVQQNVQNNVNVQVNLNHAERLASARRRKLQARKVQAGLPVIEAQFTEKKQEPDDWMDSAE
jgi:hypothetical protein